MQSLSWRRLNSYTACLPKYHHLVHSWCRLRSAPSRLLQLASGPKEIKEEGGGRGKEEELGTAMVQTNGEGRRPLVKQGLASAPRTHCKPSHSWFTSHGVRVNRGRSSQGSCSDGSPACQSTWDTYHLDRVVEYGSIRRLFRRACGDSVFDSTGQGMCKLMGRMCGGHDAGVGSESWRRQVKRGTRQGCPVVNRPTLSRIGSLRVQESRRDADQLRGRSM